MPATNGAIVEPLRPARSNPSVLPRRAVRRVDAPRLKIAEKTQQAAPECAEQARERAPTPVSHAIAAKPEDADWDGNKLLDAVEEVTSVAAKAAKDYRTWTLDQMKNTFTAALAYASGLANFPVTAAASSADLQPRKDPAAAELEQHVSPSAQVAAAFCGRAFELMSANLNATVEYAKRLGDVKSPSEFVELSTRHARRHAELVITQAVALGAFSQEFADTSAVHINPDTAKPSDRKN